MIYERKRLATLLLQLSYVKVEVTLISDRKSDYYFDCKQTALHPEGSYLIGRVFLGLLSKYDVFGVGGMTLGADPLVAAVSVLSYLYGRPLPAFIIRNQAKGHGTNQFF